MQQLLKNKPDSFKTNYAIPNLAGHEGHNDKLQVQWLTAECELAIACVHL